MNTIVSHLRTPFVTPQRLGVLVGALVCLSVPANAQITLGSASTFAVLSGASITNTGATVLTGDLGISPGATISGFGPGTVSGTTHTNDAAAFSAQSDAASAFSTLGALPADQDLTGQNLGSLTLTPGVYHFDAAALFTGLLTLDGQGQIAPLFVFQIGSALTTNSASFNLINGASSSNLYFQVGSSATLGTGTSFAGTVVSSVSNTLITGVTVDGRIFALNGSVTLDTNNISVPAAVPEPASATFLAAVVSALAIVTLRRRRA